MEQRRLYGDAKLIEALLEKLEKVEESEGGWATVYRNATTGEHWLKYYTLSSLQGGGYQVLIKLPAPVTEELIHIAIHTRHTDEAVAAILRLLDEEEVEKKDFRHQLMQEIEQQLQAEVTEQDKQRLLQIIKLSSLDDPMNRRNITGKSMQEVQADADYFSEVAGKAKVALGRLAEL